MAAYNAYSNATTAAMKANNKTSVSSAAVNELNTYSTSSRERSFTGYTDRTYYNSKVTKHSGVTPSSSVYVIDVMQIKGPRVLPLEIAWKRAETS